MSFLRALGRPLGIGVFWLGCFAFPAAAATAPLLQPCFLEGLAEEVRCGVLEVAEDASHPSGRRLPIHFAVVPTLTQNVLPDPLVILAGGPGQAATGLAKVLALGFREIRRQREILLVDLRGTGRSAPLICASVGDLLAAGRGGGLGMEVAQCLAAQVADVRFYAHESAMEDLEAVRAALGYEQVNLWGGSYGTRAALVYARRHPERVRSVILDGAVPLSLRFPLELPRHADEALEALFVDCAAEPACLAAFPANRSEFLALVERLSVAPARVSLLHPRTGEPTEVEVSAGLLTAIVRGALYVPDFARLLPHALHQAALGRFEPLFALSVETSSWSVDTMALGVTLSVLCSEDVPRLTAHEASQTVAGHILGRSEVEQWIEACRIWPHGPLPDRVDELLPLDIPALVLSGGLDPVTPPAVGERMRAHFKTSWHLVAPKAGHNVSFSPCVPERMAEFIAAASGADLELDCAASLRRPPFFVPPSSLASGQIPGGGR